MTEASVMDLPNSMIPSTTCRRLSIENAVTPQTKVSGDQPSFDATQAAVNGKQLTNRRASLDVNVEYAVAMVNENPSLDDDDRFMCPFGTRRDSVCGQAGSQAKKGTRRNLKKESQQINDNV